MFKVGMGERPEAPDDMIDEGHEFLDLCLQHNPRQRATAAELLNHNFVNVAEDLLWKTCLTTNILFRESEEINCCQPFQIVLEGSLCVNTKTV